MRWAGSSPPLRGLVGFPLPSRRASERGTAPPGDPGLPRDPSRSRTLPQVEYPGIAAGRAHGREGAAAGEPAVGPQDALFSPLERFRLIFGALCPGSGPDRETRCCGPLEGVPGRRSGRREPAAAFRPRPLRGAPVSVRACRQAPGGAVNPRVGRGRVPLRGRLCLWGWPPTTGAGRRRSGE